MNTQEFGEFLFDQGISGVVGPGKIFIPITMPSPIPPITIGTGSETVTERDGGGNITGTVQRSSTLTLTDASTPSSPNDFDVVEVETETRFDINGVPTSSTETTVEPPPQKEPEPEEPITFDNVADIDLGNFQFAADFAPVSWGSGSCPADRVVGYTGGTLVFSYQPVCDFAISINPVIIALAAFSAMFMISGIRTS